MPNYFDKYDEEKIKIIDEALLAGNREAAIQTATEIALIPPALTLAFGVALGWAFRGFRG
jgi:hypothetical protein